jgi:hypothetical protein
MLNIIAKPSYRAIGTSLQAGRAHCPSRSLLHGARHPIPVAARDRLSLRGHGRLLCAARLDRFWRRRSDAVARPYRPDEGVDPLIASGAALLAKSA